jgi:hypothetical protein
MYTRATVLSSLYIRKFERGNGTQPCNMCPGQLLGESVVAEDSSSGTNSSPGVRWWQIAAIFGGVILFLVLYLILVFSWLGEMETRGQFGDLFGGLNALFTGLAFAGVICTILFQSNELRLQREELKLQREELGLTRNELHRAADAQSEQVTRLEEAAELSAISTLVNTYGTQLRPMQDATHKTRVKMAWEEVQLAAPDADEYVITEASERLERLKEHLSLEEQGWSDTIQKHQELVERLETLVRQRSQGNGAAQNPE